MQLKRVENMSYKMICEKVKRLKAGNIRAVAAETKYIRPYSGMIVKTVYSLSEEKFINYSYDTQGSEYMNINHAKGDFQIIFTRAMTVKEIRQQLERVALGKLEMFNKLLPFRRNWNKDF